MESVDLREEVVVLVLRVDGGWDCWSWIRGVSKVAGLFDTAMGGKVSY